MTARLPVVQYLRLMTDAHWRAHPVPNGPGVVVVREPVKPTDTLYHHQRRVIRALRERCTSPWLEYDFERTLPTLTRHDFAAWAQLALPGTAYTVWLIRTD